VSRLVVRDVSIRYGERDAVTSASFVIGGPGVVAMIGPNGSGKTTLLRGLLGLVPVTGRVEWFSDAGAICDPRRLAMHASYLAQTPSAVAGQTVAQTILTGRYARRGTFDFTDTPLDEARVHAIAAELRIDDLLGRRLESLSGGQRQRVFLARCLAQETPTLLLDEPATFLDLRHQIELYEQLRRLAREMGKTILMASHDLNLAATHADRMLVMTEGRIVADGPPDDVLTTELLHRVYGVRMKRIDVDGEPHFVVART
jgi:iron complex transport system ATP-binding protein